VHGADVAVAAMPAVKPPTIGNVSADATTDLVNFMRMA
jgi:hypothetical protein